MAALTNWDDMNHPTKQVALYILHSVKGNKLAKDVARVVLDGSDGVFAIRLISEIFKAFAFSKEHWALEVGSLTWILKTGEGEASQVKFDLLARWWIEYVRTELEASPPNWFPGVGEVGGLGDRP